MADNALSPSPSPFDKLPLELLKRIVELVAAQDEAIAKTLVSRALPWPADGEVESEDEGEYEENIPYGVWSVTPRQLNSDIFRYDILGTPACTYITHVDLRLATDEELETAAWCLRQLPAAKAVSINCRHRPTLLDSGPDLLTVDAADADTLAFSRIRRSFHAFMAGVSEVRLALFNEKEGTAVLKCPAFPSSLDCLQLENGHFGGTLDEVDTDFWPALQAISPRVLRCDRVSLAVDAVSWPPSFSLPTLRTLTIPFSTLGLEPLSALQQLAPNLESLTLFDVPKRPNTSIATPLSLPHLTSLHLGGRSTCISLVASFSACPIRLADVTVRSSEVGSLSVFVPSKGWPPTLQHLRLGLPTSFRPRDFESFPLSSWFHAAKISLSLVRSPWPVLSVSRATTKLQRLKAEKRVIQEELSWAKHEVEGLFAAQDERVYWSLPRC